MIIRKTSIRIMLAFAMIVATTCVLEQIRIAAVLGQEKQGDSAHPMRAKLQDVKFAEIRPTQKGTEFQIRPVLESELTFPGKEADLRYLGKEFVWFRQVHRTANGRVDTNNERLDRYIPYTRIQNVVEHFPPLEESKKRPAKKNDEVVVAKDSQCVKREVDGKKYNDPEDFFEPIRGVQLDCDRRDPPGWYTIYNIHGSGGDHPDQYRLDAIQDEALILRKTSRDKRTMAIAMEPDKLVIPKNRILEIIRVQSPGK